MINPTSRRHHRVSHADHPLRADRHRGRSRRQDVVHRYRRRQHRRLDDPAAAGHPGAAAVQPGWRLRRCARPRRSDDAPALGGSVGTPAPGGSSSPTSGSPGPALPTLTGKQVVTAGKGKHKQVIGFQLDFNAPLNAAAAQDPSNYTVVQQTKHGHKTVSRPRRLPGRLQCVQRLGPAPPQGPAEVRAGRADRRQPEVPRRDRRRLRTAARSRARQESRDNHVITVLPGALAPAG